MVTKLKMVYKAHASETICPTTSRVHGSAADKVLKVTSMPCAAPGDAGRSAGTMR